MSDNSRHPVAGSARPAVPAPTPEQSAAVPPTPMLHIAVDDDGASDVDSAFGADDATSTASVTSSIRQYRTLHGRTYHSETGNAQYWGSNDEAQSEAMDILHHLVTLTLGDRLFLAPLGEGIQKAVDIGTGTGTWGIDFADTFPNCEVIGTDVSPIQPAWVPPNLKFEIEDCTQPWTFAPESLDFVHIRYLVGSIPDWTELFKQAYIVSKPGGYLESIEGSPVLESDDDTVGPAMAQWGTFFIEGAKKIGRTFTVLDEGIQRKAMEAAGFVDIEERDYKCPLGMWPRDRQYKEIGSFGRAAVESDVEGFVLFMANVLGWTKDEIQVYIAHFRGELRSNKHHVYFRLKGVWGRKPVS